MYLLLWWLIGLFGIAVQNGLVLISQTKGLVAEGKSFEEALREASIGRVRPKITPDRNPRFAAAACAAPSWD